MTVEQAGKVIGYLTAGFHREALEPESLAVWVADMALLADFEVAQAAAAKIVRSSDKFPTIHEFRVTYRAVLETQGPLPSLEPPPRLTKRPEWIDVWRWARTVGEERWFPQQKEHGDLTRPPMTMADYDELRTAWLVAGAPVFFPLARNEPATFADAVAPLETTDFLSSLPSPPGMSGPAVQA